MGVMNAMKTASVASERFTVHTALTGTVGSAKTAASSAVEAWDMTAPLLRTAGRR